MLSLSADGGMLVAEASELSATEILAQLQVYDGTFPRAALEAAARGDAAVRDGLLAMLEAAAQNPLELPLHASGHLYAMVFLAAWRDRRAFEPLCHFLALPSELVDHVLHEHLDHLLPRALASTCQGRPAALEAAAEVSEAYDYCRIAALRALKILMLQGELPRAQLVDFYRRLIARLPKRIEAFPWDMLVADINEIHPGELEQETRALFAAGLINPYFLRLEHMEADLAADPQDRLAAARLKSENRLIGEPLTEISRFRLFEKSQS